MTKPRKRKTEDSAEDESKPREGKSQDDGGAIGPERDWMGAREKL